MTPPPIKEGESDYGRPADNAAHPGTGRIGPPSVVHFPQPSTGPP